MERSGSLRRGHGHVPPGHEPGPQSRRSSRGRPIGLMILALATLGMLAAAVVLLLTASHAKSPSGARIGAAILGGAGLFLLLFTVWYWRRTHPRDAPYLELQVQPIELRLGDTVTATLVISDAAKLGDKLELGLVCTEYYDVKVTVADQNGSHDQRVTRTLDAYTKWIVPDRGQRQQSFQFTVPEQAPFSYEGGAASWAWRIAAVDRHAHRTDGHQDIAIWVSP